MTDEWLCIARNFFLLTVVWLLLVFVIFFRS